MIYRNLRSPFLIVMTRDITSPTREQLLIKLDRLKPVDADEYRVSLTLKRVLDEYPEEYDQDNT